MLNQAFNFSVIIVVWWYFFFERMESTNHMHGRSFEFILPRREPLWIAIAISLQFHSLEAIYIPLTWLTMHLFYQTILWNFWSLFFILPFQYNADMEKTSWANGIWRDLGIHKLVKVKWSQWILICALWVVSAYV